MIECCNYFSEIGDFGDDHRVIAFTISPPLPRRQVGQSCILVDLAFYRNLPGRSCYILGSH